MEGNGLFILIEGVLVLGGAVGFGVYQVWKTRRELARDREAEAARLAEAGRLDQATSATPASPPPAAS